jgi:hydroxymethylglutaryl-CoA lyase
MGNRTPDIYEVGTRDGLQNIKEFVPTDLKIEIIEKLLESGIKRIQLTSFVSAKVVPQMADAKEVVERVINRYPEVCFGALVPNLFGAKAAYDCGIREIAYVASVSLSHNRANINRTHEQSFEELQKIRQELPDMRIIFGAATTFSCPFEGETPLDKLLVFIGKAVACGVDMVELSDTIGMAYPAQVQRNIEALQGQFPSLPLGVHFHDTRNNGVLNSWIAMAYGLDYIQSSIGGLGGCPFAPGASGNTSTEDIVWLLNKSGYSTGIDFEKLLACAKFVQEKVSGNYSGHHIHIIEGGVNTNG